MQGLVWCADRTGLVLQFKSAHSGGLGAGRIQRFTVCEAENKGPVTFSARDRLVRALADGALAQLGLTLPVEEASAQQCLELFNSWNGMSGDVLDAFLLHRVSAHIVKPRMLHVVRPCPSASCLCLCLCLCLYY